MKCKMLHAKKVNTHFRQTLLTDSKNFSSDERNQRTFLAGDSCRPSESPQEIRNDHNFPENQSNPFCGGQAVKNRLEVRQNVVQSRRLLVALVEAKLWNRGTRADSGRVEIPNGTRQFPGFPNFRKRVQLREVVVEIIETNVRKPSVLFAFQPEFPRILVEWNAPVIFFCKDGRSVCFVLY